MRTGVPTPRVYGEQAAHYDDTRGASPSIVGPIASALAGAPGRTVLDVGGGTGNYAMALRDFGYTPVVADVSAEMLSRAQAKGLAVVRCDASRLPFADRSVDGVVSISAIHLIREWREALAEARRVLRPGGRLAMMVYTRENLGVHWVLEYFPSARRWVEREHQWSSELLAELPGARARPFQFTDLVDASMSALCRQPELLLDPHWRNQTSFFARLELQDPDELRTGVERLRREMREGRRPDREVVGKRSLYGDGTIIQWEAPADRSPPGSSTRATP